MKKAFTLAEVLITLGVIGIVATLTMPALVANYRKSVIETRLAKFYSIMHQAIKMSEVDNGETKNWEQYPHTSEGAVAADLVDWYNKYFGGYLKTVKVDTRTSITAGDGRLALVLYFPDGSAYEMSSTDLFYPDAKTAAEITRATRGDYVGTKAFAFTTFPFGVNAIEGSTYECTGKVDNPNTSQNYHCTGLIEQNGWKIPADYPFSF